MSQPINKHSGAKSIKVNAILNIIKQCSTVLFPLIIYPYISRALGTDNFGRVSFAASVVEYGTIFAMLGIQTYAVREGSGLREDKPRIKKFASELFTINLLSMLATLVVLAVLTIFVPRLNREATLIAILSVNIVSFVLGREWINTVYEDFLYISLRYIAFKTLALILILVFVKKPEDFLLYGVITLVSDSGGYLANVLYTRKYVPIRVTKEPAFHIHMKPVLLLFCTTLAIQVYIQSDILILGLLRSDSEVGIYSLASKIYYVVKSVLNAVIMVAIPRLSMYLAQKKSEDYNRLLNNLKDALIVLILPCITGAVCMSRNIMLIMGGEDYVSGTGAFMILCAALLFAVFGCFFAQGVMIPNKREKHFAYYTSFAAILNIVLNFILIPFLGIEAAAITTLIAEIAIMLTCWHNTKDLYKLTIDKGIFLVLAGCAAIFLVCQAVRLISLPLLPETAVSIILSVAVYFGILYIGKNKVVVSGVQSVLNKVKRH